MKEYGWRGRLAAEALLLKPQKERYSRYVKRIGPNKQQGNAILNPEEQSSEAEDSELEEDSSAAGEAGGEGLVE